MAPSTPPQVPKKAQKGGSLPEDRRQAAVLQVSISSYVATAALAVLVGAAGIFTYVSQTYQPPCAFYVLIASTALALVASIFIGGKGSGIAIRQIASGTWTPNSRNGRYAAQAGLTLLGLFLLLASTAVGVTAPRQSSDLERRVERIAREVDHLMNPRPDPQDTSEKIWLEHLIATSDYRIAKLKAQRQQGFRDGISSSVKHHLSIQEGVQSQQCDALGELLEEAPDSQGSGHMAACPGG